MNAIQAKHAIDDITSLLVAAERAHANSSHPSEGWAAWYARWIVQNRMSQLQVLVDETRMNTEDWCGNGCY